MPDYRLWAKSVQDEIESVSRTLGPAGMKSVMGVAGKYAAAGLEASVSPYPVRRPVSLPLAYTRTVTARRPYVTADGARRKPGDTYKSKFKSLRQQRYVLALAKRGGVPRKRTGLLGKSINARVVKVTATGFEAALGTNLKYAPYVIDRERQAPIHQGIWTPLQEDVENSVDRLEAAILRGLAAGVEAELK